MDWFLIILIIVTLGMGGMTFLQFNKMQKAKRQFMQNPLPNPQMQPNPHPEYSQQIQQSPQMQEIRQQNINRVANKDYKQVYQNLAQEMQQKKQEARQNTQSEILKQKKIYEAMQRQKQTGGKIEFDRTVDEQNWERNNLWAINEAKQPTEKSEFIEPVLDQQQYWSQNQNLVYILLGVAGFVLFIVMVL